jgi:putative heme-binding domain-containing protein
MAHTRMATMERLRRESRRELSALVCFAALFVFSAESVHSRLEAADGGSPGFRVPEGFRIENVADEALAHDIYCMTLDARGDPIVSGPGYIRRLVPSDDRRRYERAIDYSRGPPSGCMGLASRGDRLYTVGGAGLEVYEDADRDGTADGPPRVLIEFAATGEHAGHALRFDGEGALWFIGGDGTRLPSGSISPDSPVRAPHGGIFGRIRFDENGEPGKVDVWSHGMRNAYDFDFLPGGEAIAFDSDTERDEGLVWYRPCRLVQLSPGTDHGWRSHGSLRPPVPSIDAATPIASVHRGSPTGVVTYRIREADVARHPAARAFPHRYRGGVFALDWTFGRIYFFAPRIDGSTYTATPELFIEAERNVTFAPTDMAILPDGALLVTSGGRGIRGGVFRIDWEGATPKSPADEGADAAVERANVADPPSDSSIALARAALASIDLDETTLGRYVLDEDPFIARTAAEHCLRRFARGHDEPEPVVRHLTRCLIERARNSDRDLRRALAAALARSPLLGELRALPAAQASVGARIVTALAWVLSTPRGEVGREGVDVALDAIADPKASESDRADACRVILLGFERAATDPEADSTALSAELPDAVFDDAAPLVERTLRACRSMISSGGPGLAVEALRLAARLRDDAEASASAALSRITPTTSVADDVFHLWALARLRGGISESDASRLVEIAVELPAKIRAQTIERDPRWHVYLEQIWTRIFASRPSILARTIDDPRFGDPDHTSLVAAAGSELRAKACARFLDRPWPEDFSTRRRLALFLAAESPIESRKRLVAELERLDDPALEDVRLRAAAPLADPAWYERFVESLERVDPLLVPVALDGLDALPLAADGEREAAALLRVLARYATDASRRRWIDRVIERLAKLCGNTETPRAAGNTTPDQALIADWTKRVVERFPQLRTVEFGVETKEGTAGQQVDEFVRRIAWSEGNASRGRDVFERRGCVSCHHVGGVGQRVGPDLVGIGRRLRDTEALLTEIVDPNRRVAAQYSFREYVLDGGELVLGIEIYRSDVVLLTGPDGMTRRIDPRRIMSEVERSGSLMPDGLLDGVGDGDIADLVAYLAGL